MKVTPILLLSVLLQASLCAEQEKKRIIQADTRTIGKILHADREKIRVKFTNHNSFAIDVHLLDAILQKKNKDGWEDLREGFRDNWSSKELPQTRFQQVKAGETLDIDFRPGHKHLLQQWAAADTIILTIMYWPSGNEKRSKDVRLASTENYNCEQAGSSNGEITSFNLNSGFHSRRGWPDAFGRNNPNS